MAYTSLRDFISALEKTGQLVRVTEPVSTYLEMTEIGTRLINEKGPAVLFENVTGHTTPVLINLFGTVERVAFALGRKPEELRDIGKTLAFLKQPEPPGGWKEALSMLPVLKNAMAMKPKTVSKAPCQEVVLTGDDIDLAKLPIQTCWPDEPAPLITWPLVVTKGPQAVPEDNFNLGIYRMQAVLANPAAYSGEAVKVWGSMDQPQVARWQRCEHVSFHLGLRQQGGRLLVLPDLINADASGAAYPADGFRGLSF